MENTIDIKEVHLCYYYNPHTPIEVKIKDQLENISNLYGGSEYFKSVDVFNPPYPELLTENKIRTTPTAVISVNGNEYVRLLHNVTVENCVKYYLNTFRTVNR